MKDQYFDKTNISQQTKKMIKKLKKSHGSRIGYEINSKTAMIVTDMQNYFLKKKSHAFVPSVKAVIPKIKKLCDLFSEKNMTVIYTRHTNNDSNSGQMSEWWRDVIEDETKESRIADCFNYKDAIVVEKHQYDAFYGTNLKDILQERGITQLIITGVLTHLCCESTARAGFINGYKILFPVNGTATYNIKHHKSTLRNLSHGFAVPVTMEELIKKVKAI
jgi:isochorismate hydrolase